MLRTKNWTLPAMGDPIIRPVFDGRIEIKQELWFMCTALPVDEIKYEKQQRPITQKLSEQEL